MDINTGNSKKNSLSGILAVIAAGSLWGIIGIFVRYFSALGLTSMQIVAVRVLVTAVVFLLGLLIFKPALLKIRLRHIWCFIGTGFISIVIFSWCYFLTIEKTSLSAAAVLLYAAPTFVVLLSALLFREKLTWKKMIACVAAFCGCALVCGVFSGGAIPPAAIATGLVSALGYALYSIFGRFAIRYGYSSPTISAYTFLFAALGVLPFADPAALTRKILSGNVPQNIFLGILLGVVTACLPYLLYTAGLERLESGKAAVIASVEPIVATLTGILVFHEILTLSAGIGIILVVVAIVVLNL